MTVCNNMRNLLILMVVVSCLQPITLGHRHRHMQHKRRFARGSSNVSKKITVTVNKTAKNITPPKSNVEDPKLRPVNTELEQGAPKVATLLVTPAKNEEKIMDGEVFKTLLRDLLDRLDTNPVVATADNPLNTLNNPMLALGKEGPRHINSRDTHHCVLHGLWLSTVAGAAIELIPEQKQGHIEIHTKIFELPDNPFPSLINSQWTGKGIISQESPTTITVVFQEHIETEKENNAKERGVEKDDGGSVIIQLPRTAVFVGQCLICQGNPTLQGAWVVFPASQTCTAGAGFATHDHGEGGAQQQPDSIRMSSSDAIYLLKYY